MFRGTEVKTAEIAVIPPPRQRQWGKIVRDIREERGISQRALADLAQVNRSSLRRIEEGKTDGQMETVERILGVLGYELEAHLVRPGTLFAPDDDVAIVAGPSAA